jgi:type II secretory pathway pseudopilin PulG
MGNRRAFTIIELIVVAGLGSILGAIVVSVVVKSLSDNRRVEATSLVQRDINLGVDNINKVLRSTTQILEATNTTLRVRAYRNVGDAAPSEIYYRIATHNGEQAVRYDVTPASGTAPNYTYDPQDTETFTLLPKVTNSDLLPLFKYYNEENVLLPVPVSLSEVRVIEVLPSCLDITGMLINPITVTTKATLRNFKTNL